ncbi:ArsR/SmtB family transcription factor [Gudongella sp. DL1XJH-153]|uniref:ArsR/SmtB family transcription factor n=1 Tax=Gudongella sp. DL1XJH-153 TaxID=3409804 RepID=UPI003BB70BCE
MDRRVEVLKALADKNRLLILDMLSCGDMCACDIMEGLELTQPTISHHMKILVKSGVVEGKKAGKWVNYSINHDVVEDLSEYINYLTNQKEDCICYRKTKICKL